MKPAFITFIKQLLFFSAILGSVALVFVFILPKTYISPAFPFLICFFIATSLLSFYYLLKQADKRFIKFVNAFLLTIIIKLALYIGVMVVYALNNRRDAVPFMLAFFILYLCYTIFEAVCIIKNTQPSSNKP